MLRRLLIAVFMSCAVILPAAGFAFASDGSEHGRETNSHHRDDGHDDRDHEAREQVRNGVLRGELKPLAEVLRLVEPMLPGTVVGTEIENKNGTWFYEFRVVDTKGRLFDVYVDAATAKISEIKEK